MQSRGRSEESRGKNVQSVYDGTTTPQQTGCAGKRVKPERQQRVGCQAWKVLGWRGG